MSLSLMRRTERGVTLMELLLVAAISLIVLVVVTTIDATRLRISEDVRSRSGALQLNHGRAALVAWRLSKELEGADRLVLVAPNAQGISTNFKVRIPTVVNVDGAGFPLDSNFNTAANYRWDEYKLAGTQIQLFRNMAGGCPAAEVISDEIQQLQFSYSDEFAIAPPGGEPFGDGRDNNMLHYLLQWGNGTNSHMFTGEVAIRSAGYTNVNASCPASPAACDSGRGLAEAGVNDTPPNSC